MMLSGSVNSITNVETGASSPRGVDSLRRHFNFALTALLLFTVVALPAMTSQAYLSHSSATWHIAKSVRMVDSTDEMCCEVDRADEHHSYEAPRTAVAFSTPKWVFRRLSAFLPYHPLRSPPQA